MRKCKCGISIPNRTLIDGKYRSLQNRTSCLICVPFGSSPYSQKQTLEQRLTKNAEKQRRHYSRHVLTHGMGRANKIRKTRKAQIVAHLGNSCMVCGYSKCMRNLIFHHVMSKDFSLPERSFQFSWEKLLPEIAKCVLLCHNCHGEVHEGILDVSKLTVQVNQLLKDFNQFLTRSGEPHAFPGRLQ